MGQAKPGPALGTAGQDRHEPPIADMKFPATPVDSLRKKACDPHDESKGIARYQHPTLAKRETIFHSLDRNDESH